MEREDRYFDREAEEERHKNDLLEKKPARHADELCHIERVRRSGKINPQNPKQHKKTAGQRIKEELDRGVFTARPAPDPDQEIHRNKHDLPEHIEKKKVEGEERPHHAGLKEQEQEVIFLFAGVLDADMGKRTVARHKRNDRREDDHGKADPVGPKEVLDAELGDPHGPFHHLEAGFGGLEHRERVTGERRHDTGRQERDPFDGAGSAFRDKKYGERAYKRRKNDPGKNVGCHVKLLLSMES